LPKKGTKKKNKILGKVLTRKKKREAKDKSEITRTRWGEGPRKKRYHPVLRGVKS